jgi:hypothetical protein
MSDARRWHFRATLTSVALVACCAAAFGACTSYQRSNGSACIKDVDCLTGYCQAQVCASLPETLNGNSYEDGGEIDSASPPEASTPDTSSPTDSSSDSAG